MQRHAHAGLHVQAQGFICLHALDVEHGVAIEHGQVAALSKHIDKSAQQRAARAGKRAVRKHGQCELGGARTERYATVGAARIRYVCDIAQCFQRFDHARQGRLRDMQACRQLRQRKRLSGRGKVLDDDECAQNTGVLSGLFLLHSSMRRGV
jgi:hypothetical protein